MEKKNKYKHLANLLSDDNQLDNNIYIDNQNNLESEKIIYFWEHAKLEDFDPSTIILKTTQKIEREKSVRRRKRLLLKYTSVAASILIILSFGLFLYKNNMSNNNSIELAQTIEEEKWSEEVIIINSSDEKIVVNQDALIKYTKEGDITTEVKEIEKNSNIDSEQPAEGYNHLIVPRGKRSRVELSDGTKMWVNSGSKVTFPRVFGSNERKIYVQGEVYLEVEKDVSRPFIVTSDNFDLKVLGTKFNITSYPEANYSSVILVQGSVQIDDLNNKSIQLSPNELLELERGYIKSKKIVDTHYYISWVEGYMMLNGESLADVSNRITQYYGTKIQCDSDVKDMKIYGKLALKENLSEIIEAIETIIPIKTEITPSQIQFSKKQ